MEYRRMEVMLEQVVRSYAVVVLDENDNLVDIEQINDEIERVEPEILDVFGPVDENGPTEFDQNDFI